MEIDDVFRLHPDVLRKAHFYYVPYLFRIDRITQKMVFGQMISRSEKDEYIVRGLAEFKSRFRKEKVEQYINENKFSRVHESEWAKLLLIATS